MMAKTPVRVMLEYLAKRERKCTKCGTIKALSEFSKSTRERLGIRSECKVCVSDRERRRYYETIDLQLARGKEYRKNNRAKDRARLKLWRQKNPEHDRLMSLEWRRNNPEKAKAIWARSYGNRRKSCKYRLESAVRAMVNAGLMKGAKRGRTFAALGYSVDDLRVRLESQFTRGMSWENYGRGGWEIDHIVPLNTFEYSSPEDPEFNLAWALSNLQPLWHLDNRRKGSKMNGIINSGVTL